MDLEILRDGVGFKVRTAAVVVRDGRVLLHGHPRRDVWLAPGGGVAFGETTRDAVAREVREELGAEPAVGRLLWVVEHFFELRKGSRRWHQLGWFYEVTLPSDCDAARRESWESPQPDGCVAFRWVPLAELSSLPIIPGLLREGLRELPSQPRRVVHVDRLP